MQPQPKHVGYNDSRGSPTPSTSLATRGIPLLEHDHPPLNYARRHHVGIPCHGDPGYAQYKHTQRIAFGNAVRELEKELGTRSQVKHIVLQNQTLIVRHYSQSKLSQQELADLQKATHFDKKELQQWYKGQCEPKGTRWDCG